MNKILVVILLGFCFNINAQKYELKTGSFTPLRIYESGLITYLNTEYQHLVEYNDTRVLPENVEFLKQTLIDGFFKNKNQGVVRIDGTRLNFFSNCCYLSGGGGFIRLRKKHIKKMFDL